MDERRPSQTAAMVAMLRALADEGFTTAKGFRDPVAQELLSRRWRLMRRVATRMLRRATEAGRAPALGHFDLVPLRVLAIDEELKLAVAAGLRQVVILGAGLDTRAWRMPELSETRVFEVDHPQTQAWKRRRAEPLRRTAKSVTFVPVDFEKDSLGEALRIAGHHRDEPTVWIWEGVVMYLTDEAVRTTLATIGAASAHGSVALVQYNEPGSRVQRESKVRDLLLSWWREPQIGLRTREQMLRLVTEAGLNVLRDSGADEWATRFGAQASTIDMAPRTRLAVVSEI